MEFEGCAGGATNAAQLTGQWGRDTLELMQKGRLKILSQRDTLELMQKGRLKILSHELIEVVKKYQ